MLGHASKMEIEVLMFQKEAEVPPRLELGSLDSESKVLTITPWDQGQMEAQAGKVLLGVRPVLKK